MNTATDAAADTSIVTRVTELRLRNYRGFKAKGGTNSGGQAHVLDTNADVVLISGPNGHGKTSLLEALCLLLTGWYGNADPVKDLISLLPCKDSETEAEPAQACEIEAAVPLGAAGKRHLYWTKDHTGPLPVPANHRTQLARHNGERAPQDRELDARLCAFFQDRIHELFDAAASGKTLRDVFEPLPWPVKRVAERLPRLGEDLQAELVSDRYKDDWGGAPESVLNANLASAWQAVAGLLQEVAALSPDWPADPAIPEAVADDAAMDAFARSLLTAGGRDASSMRPGDLRDAFTAAIEGRLGEMIKRARREAANATAETRELSRQIDEVQAQLRALAERYPDLDSDLKLFAAELPGEPGLPDALAIFRALARNARRWAAAQLPPSESTRLSRVLEEFAAVDEQEAARCAELLAVWLEPRWRARGEHEELARRLPELQEELERSLVSERLEQLRALRSRLEDPLRHLAAAWKERHRLNLHRRRQRGREDARVQLQSALTASDWCRKEVRRLMEPDEVLLEEVRERANRVLRRFNLVEGFLPLRLEPEEDTADGGESIRRSYRIKTKDRRLLQHLSTGQKAQVAVSFLVAQNLAISHKLSHRVILLDDVTTAYDLSNLTREAILWRQLAYGEQKEQMRRQLFISSHHEDMSNHMLDLLVPPKGRSMLMIRFTGWSPKDGPDFEIFEVAPSAFSASAGGQDTADAKKRQALALDLQRF